MKSKATSFGIAALMVLMAFCCVSVTDEVDASYTTLTGMHFDADDDKKSRLFTVNEGEFYGYAYTISIGVVTVNNNTNPSGHTILYVKDVKADGTLETPTDVITSVGGNTVDIKKNGDNKGSYIIEISKNDQNEFNYTLDVKIDMKVTVGSIVVEMDPIHLRMSVSTSESDSINPTLNSMDFQVGKYNKIRVSEHTESALGSIDLYHWYAEGLPEGLSMSENGFVSGIAEAAQLNVPVKVYIFGHEGNGEYTANLIINVNAATNDPDYFSYRIEGSVVDSTNAYDYVAVEGSELKLILTPKDPSGSITFTVGYINDNNVYSSSNVILNGNNVGECTLTAKGTGCYKVNIEYEKDDPKEQEAKFFHIYVIPAFDVVQAQMTIASS